MHAIDQSVNAHGDMAYVLEEGKTWHGLGVAIPKGVSAREVGKAAGILWPVERTPVMFEKKGQVETDLSHQVIYRGDTGSVLDITGKGYIPHQNEEVLEFFQEYVDAGSMFIDTAGSLQGGKYIWVQAKINEGFDLGGGDQVHGRVLLMNPHQYGKGMIGKVVMTRVVCWNTVQMALGEGGRSVKIPHIKAFDKARRDEAKRNLGIAAERVDAFKADAKKLAKLRLDDEKALDLLVDVLKGKKDQPLEQQGRTVTRVFELYKGAGLGATLKTAQDTGWGLLNALTQYIDHEYGRTADARVTNSWLGQGDIQKRGLMAALLQEAA